MSKQRIEKNVQIITIDKTEAFKYKTTFFAGKDAKTGHKNASNTADKHPHTPAKASRRPGSAPLPHPGLRGSYTRVSKRLFKPFLTKEKPVLMKNEAVLTCFVPVPGRSLLLSYN